MKIKLIDNCDEQYEDVSPGKTYEVVQERDSSYVIIDDQYDHNAILKEHCEIVTEKTMFNKGDKAVVIRNEGNEDVFAEWSLPDGIKNGDVVEVMEDSYNPDCRTLSREQWYFPGEVLKPYVEEDTAEQPTTSLITRIQSKLPKSGHITVEICKDKIIVSDYDGTDGMGVMLWECQTEEELDEIIQSVDVLEKYRAD